MSKYKITISTRYKHQRKKLSPTDKDALDAVIQKLSNGEALDIRHKDHALLGKYKDYRECHIKPNLLLMYRIYENVLELYLAQVGSHSELF